MNHSSAASVLAALLCLSAPLRGGLIDPLDDTSNFNAGFNGTTATANGDGTVTLTRTLASEDAGIDWLITGTTPIPLGERADRVELFPVGPVNGGFYNVTIQFFDGGGSFVGEANWIADTQSTATQVLPSVPAFAAANGISGPESYQLRFRIQPFNQANAAFQFDQINAVPEPLGILGLGAALALMGTRRRPKT